MAKRIIHIRSAQVLILGLLLTALCVGWGHVHAPEKDPGHAHACLICQWSGMSALVVVCTIRVSCFEAPEFLAHSADFAISPSAYSLLRGRSPPSAHPF